mgnify:CR=1 FL=1
MTSLATRKQLLIAESELNREQLREEIKRVTTVAGVTAGVGLLAWLAGRKSDSSARPQTPWWHHLMKGAGLVGTLWRAFKKR